MAAFGISSLTAQLGAAFSDVPDCFGSDYSAVLTKKFPKKQPGNSKVRACVVRSGECMRACVRACVCLGGGLSTTSCALCERGFGVPAGRLAATSETVPAGIELCQ